MSAHTSTPWRLQPRQGYEQDIVGITSFGHEYTVARVGMIANGEGEANARLITASPRLYAVLKHLIEAASNNCGDSMANGLLEAEALLAAIDGESS